MYSQIMQAVRVPWQNAQVPDPSDGALQAENQPSMAHARQPSTVVQ